MARRHSFPWPSLAIALAAIAAYAPATPAGEAVFGYVYTTDTLPRGKSEVEQWITDRRGQAYRHFDDFNLRTEYEYGLSDNVQLGGYLNYSYQYAHGNSVRHATEGLDLPWNHDASRSYSGSRFDGVSVEMLWRVLSPFKDPIGLAFYLEPEYGQRERGLEFRAIVQKNFLDDRLTLAANLMIEPERERASNLVDPAMPDEMPDSRRQKITYAEIDLGASYRFAPNWSVGLELRNHNEYSGYSLAHSHQEHTAFFLGPNIHYGGKRWFFTLSALRQVDSITYSAEQDHQKHHNMLYGDEHTRWDGIRLKVGYSFE
ncbi:autotransporter outer membrane beta-barrel domain-containing protein [Dyella sedimenti]|uniref:autotransporter outer membrane beta-barrel domain-containing protein n=1 Tax=Dyella sedimenti TaxID=2919947 RepID=UPI001FAAD59B|nr:autotransporter outer membrane beta-barrel domain-containing protein [Dyella sedimenti]